MFIFHDIFQQVQFLTANQKAREKKKKKKKQRTALFNSSAVAIVDVGSDEEKYNSNNNFVASPAPTICLNSLQFVQPITKTEKAIGGEFQLTK